MNVRDIAVLMEEFFRERYKNFHSGMPNPMPHPKRGRMTSGMRNKASLEGRKSFRVGKKRRKV